MVARMPDMLGNAVRGFGAVIVNIVAGAVVSAEFCIDLGLRRDSVFRQPML